MDSDIRICGSRRSRCGSCSEPLRAVWATAVELAVAPVSEDEVVSEDGVVSEEGVVSETRSGYKQSASGLVGALLMALLLIAAVWVLSLVHGRPTPQRAEPIDYAAELALARSQAPFEVLAPRQLPSGWDATSASWNGAGPEVSWHLGIRTDETSYVGLEQSNQSTSRFVEARTPADQPAEPVSIAGETWVGLTSADGEERAFVLAAEGVTTIVTGTASEPDLIAFAESLSSGE